MGEPLQERLRSLGARNFGPGWAPELIVRAPGRIEIIGNHVDYNGGPVLAAAIDREIRIAACTTSGAELWITFGDTGEAEPDSINPRSLDDWRLGESKPGPGDYMRGAIASLIARGLPIRDGLEIVVAGSLPAGLGLSSSAALCVGLTLMLSESRPPDRDLVLIAQEAEHRVGTPCGTMDQSASVAGGLIAYSGADDSVVPIAATLGDHQFVVINSGIERSLATSAYPERVRESQEVLSMVREGFGSDLASLAELRNSELAAADGLLVARGAAHLAPRVRHVVTECDRVGRAAVAIESDDWTEVGRLMTASGESSSRDYAISHPAVDEIVRISLGVEGVLGARMMGGGEGGAALALVHRDAVSSLSKRLEDAYFGPNGLSTLATRVLSCSFSPGAGLLETAR